MKRYYKILLMLMFIPLVWACTSEEEQFDISSLSVGFARTGIDVGENSGILSIPVRVEGSKMASIDFKLSFKAIEGTAKEGVNYKMVNKTLSISSTGETMLDVEIINNEDIETENLTFSVEIENTGGARKLIGKVDITIINDDSEKEEVIPAFVGKYTFTAKSAFDDSGATLSGPAGKVTITQDAENKNKFYINDFYLVEGEYMLPMSMSTSLYFTADGDKLTMPTMQQTGQYAPAYPTSVFIGITNEYVPVTTPLTLTFNSNKLTFGVFGLAVFVTENGMLLTDGALVAIYNAVLTKVQ